MRLHAFIYDCMPLYVCLRVHIGVFVASCVRAWLDVCVCVCVCSDIDVRACGYVHVCARVLVPLRLTWSTHTL